jgi:hypothetical protein
MKYTAFCGGKKMEILQHVSKKSVNMSIDQIYGTWSFGGSSTSVQYVGLVAAETESCIQTIAFSYTTEL